MEVKELTKILNDCQEGDEVSKEIEQIAKDNNLVIIFGASDDLMELRGAIDDELDCYEGGTAYFDSLGLIVNKCDDNNCPYYALMKKSAAKIRSVWCATKEYAWTYETDIPHETFNVILYGVPDEYYCKGIVFKLSDI